MESLLLLRENDPHRPSLENRVAYQWETASDLIGFRTSNRRNGVVLGWLADALTHGTPPAAMLDVGCGYGNHILMLNSQLQKRANVSFHGVDLYPESLKFAQAFATHIMGYSNCHFAVANLEEGLPFADATFDAINLSDVLEHLESPTQALLELKRITKPGGTIVVSTPLKTSLFKELARVLNKVTFGMLYKQYYSGKSADLDEHGQPVMETHAGHDHISEMNYGELLALAQSVGLKVTETALMPIMSGSTWFDRHPFLLSFILFFEAIHDTLKLPRWAHSICLRLQK